MSSVESNFEKLDYLLSSLVESIKEYKKNPRDENRKRIEKDLFQMKNASKILGGKILEEYVLLEENISNFFVDLTLFDFVLEKCVHLKNELWKL